MSITSVLLSILMRRRFRKLNRKYPLRHFQDFLSKRVTSYTVAQYLAAFRKFLYDCGPEAWRDSKRTTSYFQSLFRRDQGNFSGAWRQWCFFVEEVEPESAQLVRLTLTFHNDMRALAEAIHRLLKFPICSRNILDVELLDWTWKRNAAWGVWTVYAPELVRPPDQYVYFPRNLQPLLDLIRQWGWPDGCHNGYAFLPRAPMDMDEKMSKDALTKMLQREVPLEVKARVDALLDAAASARAAAEASAEAASKPAGPGPADAPADAPAAAPEKRKSGPALEYIAPEPDEFYKNFELPPE